MRIAFFEVRHESFYGAQKSLLTLFDGLRAADLPVEAVLVTTGEGPLSDAFREAGHKVEILTAGSRSSRFGGAVIRDGWLGKLFTALELVRFNIRVRQWLNAQEIDLVYANNARSMMFCGPGAVLSGLPRLWYVRGDKRVAGLFPLALRLASRVLLIAEAVGGAFTTRERRRYRNRFRILNTGFDVSAFARTPDARIRLREALGIPSTDRIVGIVGSISERKGHDVFLEAVAPLMEKFADLHVLVVGAAVEGSAPFAAELRSRTSSAPWSSRWRWMGYRQDVADCYAAMDVLVLPSRGEGLPRTVVEALAAGLPVVASSAGASRELLAHPEFGEIVDPLNAESLSIALVKVLNMGTTESAREHRQAFVADKLSIPAYVNGFYAIAREMVHGR